MMRRILTTICILLLFTSTYTFAATISSNGTGGGDWDATGTWSGGVVPVDGDDIIIVAGDVVVIDGTPDIPNDADGIYTNVTIIIEGELSMEESGFFPRQYATLTLDGNSGIRLDGGSITESLGNFEEGYGTIVINDDIVWAACNQLPGNPTLQAQCITYVQGNYPAYTKSLEELGDITGDGLLLPAANNPLPIELVSINAQVVDKSVVFNWITAAEINNDYFTLERSIDGLDFHELTTMPGAGNSSETLNYTYTDKNPFFGISYYRLKQTDYDGQFEYFNTIVVRLDHGLQELDFTIFPNPTKDKVYVQMTGNAVLDTKIEMYNAQGQMVDYSVSSNNIDGFELDVEHLNAGIYLVHLINDKYQGVRKFYKR